MLGVGDLLGLGSSLGVRGLLGLGGLFGIGRAFGLLDEVGLRGPPRQRRFLRFLGFLGVDETLQLRRCDLGSVRRSRRGVGLRGSLGLLSGSFGLFTLLGLLSGRLRLV